MVAQELIILWAGHPGSLCPGTEHVLSFSLNCTCWLKYFPRKMNKLSEKPHSLSLEMCYCVKVSNMSLFSEMSGLFPFSPQVHRQARVGICGKWHWNSRNQQFCTGIDPPALAQLCNICLCLSALSLLFGHLRGCFYCFNCMCNTVSIICDICATSAFW